MIDQFVDKRAFTNCPVSGQYLSIQQIEDFNRDGYLVIRDVLPIEEIQLLRTAADQLFDTNGGGEWVGGPELKDEALGQYVQSPLVKGVINDLNGESNVLLGFLYRKSRDFSMPKLWHQDGVYWNTSDARVMALFTPLTPIHKGNGAIHVIPGSHRLGRLFHKAAENYNLVCDTAAFRDGVIVEMVPGDIMALHSLTLHQSPPNTTNETRINFGLHFHNTLTRVVRDAPTAELYEKAG